MSHKERQMADRAKKKQSWPTQHLVLWRTSLDDVPLLLTPDRTFAMAYAKSNVPESELRRAEDALGIDRCSPTNITVVSFRNGFPYRSVIVRDIGDDEPIREPRTRRTTI